MIGDRLPRKGRPHVPNELPEPVPVAAGNPRRIGVQAEESCCKLGETALCGYWFEAEAAQIPTRALVESQTCTHELVRVRRRFRMLGGIRQEDTLRVRRLPSSVLHQDDAAEYRRAPVLARQSRCGRDGGSGCLDGVVVGLPTDQRFQPLRETRALQGWHVVRVARRTSVPCVDQFADACESIGMISSYRVVVEPVRRSSGVSGPALERFVSRSADCAAAALGFRCSG